MIFFIFDPYTLCHTEGRKTSERAWTVESWRNNQYTIMRTDFLDFLYHFIILYNWQKETYC